MVDYYNNMAGLSEQNIIPYWICPPSITSHGHENSRSSSTSEDVAGSGQGVSYNGCSSTERIRESHT